MPNARLALFAFAVLTGLTLTSVAQVPQSQRELHVINLAPDFDAFWTRTQGQPIEARIVEFKRDIGSRFPDFYGIARFGGERSEAEQDNVIRHAIEGFPAIRERYMERAARFDSALPQAVASFTRRFPDFRPSVPVYVLHSLGEADGGTRSLPHGDVLFFGIDSMVRFHGNGDDTPFFHHELFHTYHTPRLADCAGGPMWAYLWIEGLATYVSKALNPGASEAELLLDIPAGMAARYRDTLAESLAQFEQVADSTDRAVYRDLFTRASTGSLPGRRGYYLGYLVAAEAARTRDLPTLASLGCPQVREVVFSTIHTLRTSGGIRP
jgi:hypothetical protein